MKRKLAALMAAALLTAATLAGCSAGEDGEGQGDNTLRVTGTATLETLNVLGDDALNIATVWAGRQIFDSMVRRSGTTVEPRLATSWELEDDLIWTFHLREGVTFHDGTPFTATDVKASIERAQQSSGPISGYWAGIASIDIVDDLTIQITTTTPVAAMLTNMESLLVAPADRVNDEAFWQAPIGTGPFAFESWRKGDRLVLSSNPDYWDGAPSIDMLEFLDIPETTSRVTAMITGEIDVMLNVSTDDISTLEEAENVEIVTAPSYRYYMMWFNNATAPFDDVRVRQAMWYALDLDTIQADLFGDLGNVGSAPMSQAAIGAVSLDPYPYDPELAKELLAEAGLADGFSTSMQWSSQSGPQIRQMAQAMASYWAEIGVTVEMLEKEQAVWSQDFNDSNFDINLQAHSGALGNADSVIGRLYYSATEKRHNFADAEVDALIEQAKATLDDDERYALYAQAEERIWELAPGIWPMDLNGIYAVNTRVQGFEPQPDERPLFAGVSLSE